MRPPPLVLLLIAVLLDIVAVAAVASRAESDFDDAPAVVEGGPMLGEDVLLRAEAVSAIKEERRVTSVADMPAVPPGAAECAVGAGAGSDVSAPASAALVAAEVATVDIPSCFSFSTCTSVAIVEAGAAVTAGTILVASALLLLLA